MTETVVVLGAGYAGAGAVTSLESELPDEVDVTWVSDTDYHFVLHESHRCIRNPSVAEKITVPVDRIKSSATEFVEGEVVTVETDDRTVELADDLTVQYDYLVVAIGSRTAFFGIPGLKAHAHTLKRLEDALGIHDAVETAAREATRTDPARVVVGGAGLSGIQTAGEIAEFRDDRRAPIDITLVEGLAEILPGSDPELQAALRERLEARGVNILTGEFVGEVDEKTVYVGEDRELPYDVLVWTGGITGREAIRNANVEMDDRTHRIHAAGTFQTNDERVFALGDCALVAQPGDHPAPPTAQAAWQAAEVVGENVARAIRGQPLKTWTHEDKGTVVSVGEDAVAHDVVFAHVSTFGGLPARVLKKGIAARWLADVAGVTTAVRAWPDM